MGDLLSACQAVMPPLPCMTMTPGMAVHIPKAAVLVIDDYRPYHFAIAARVGSGGGLPAGHTRVADFGDFHVVTEMPSCSWRIDAVIKIDHIKVIHSTEMR